MYPRVDDAVGGEYGAKAGGGLGVKSCPVPPGQLGTVPASDAARASGRCRRSAEDSRFTLQTTEIENIPCATTPKSSAAITANLTAFPSCPLNSVVRLSVTPAQTGAEWVIETWPGTATSQYAFLKFAVKMFRVVDCIASIRCGVERTCGRCGLFVQAVMGTVQEVVVGEGRSVISKGLLML
jgi:hypothetical protein